MASRVAGAEEKQHKWAQIFNVQEKTIFSCLLSHFSR